MRRRSSMRRDDDIRLRHMLDAAREAVAFARGRTRADLDKDRQLVLALVKDVEIVGEAATQVTEPARQRLAQIPWERIVGMRNRLVHAYFDINLDIVWNTVTGRLARTDLTARTDYPARARLAAGDGVVARDHRAANRQFSLRGAGAPLALRSDDAPVGPRWWSVGYVVASSDWSAFDDPGVFGEIPLVNLLPRRREQPWPGKQYNSV